MSFHLLIQNCHYYVNCLISPKIKCAAPVAIKPRSRHLASRWWLIKKQERSSSQARYKCDEILAFSAHRGKDWAWAVFYVALPCGLLQFFFINKVNLFCCQLWNLSSAFPGVIWSSSTVQCWLTFSNILINMLHLYCTVSISVVIKSLSSFHCAENLMLSTPWFMAQGKVIPPVFCSVLGVFHIFCLYLLSSPSDV